MTARSWGSVAAIVLFIFFMTFVVPHWVNDREKGNVMVASMDKCLEEERPKGMGQDYIATTYRVCWMRAKSNHK